MNSSDLRVFETVAREGAMNRAAAVLHTVQSNVTARVRLLEQALGQQLFSRHSRGVHLTPAGRRLLPYAQQIGRLLEDAAQCVADDGTPQGTLTLGSLETTAALRLPPILSAYAADHPAVDLALRPGTTEELILAVLARQLEGAFVCGPVNEPALAVETVFEEELVLVTARSVGALEDLVAQGELKIVVLRLGCSYRQRLEAILVGRGMVGLRRLEFGTIDGIVGAVSAGLGVTLLPKSIVGGAWREGRVAVHELPLRDAKVETLFVRRTDALVSSALSVFLDYVGATRDD